MSEPTPFGLSRLFSQLTGRKVTFSQAPAGPDTKIRQVYAIYHVLPDDIAVVVKTDLVLIGSLAGVLVGLPDAAVKDRIGILPLEELLRDAIHEVLNIASAAVSTEGRAIFTKMVMDPAYIDGAAEEVFKKPHHKSYFNVVVDGYQGGKFSIFSPFFSAKSIRS